MSVDMEALARIHRIEVELSESAHSVKTLLEARQQLLEDLPEYQAVIDADEAAKQARERLRLALGDSRELNKLEVDLGEARFKRRDLGEILSHHLVVYTQDTGREVIKDSEGRTRQIELRAKEGKPALDQTRLPLGLGKHFGAHVEIPTAPEPQHLEVA